MDQSDGFAASLWMVRQAAGVENMTGKIINGPAAGGQSEPLLPPVLRGVVGRDQNGRLDQFLPQLDPRLSRRLARTLIDLGGVHVDGRRLRRCGFQVQAGSKVEVYYDGLPARPWTLEGKSIIFRDTHLLVINKPIGLPSQPTPARYLGTLYQGLIDYLGKGQQRQKKAGIGMVQRLDRDTSGLMIFSIHPAAHKGLTAAFSQHDVSKIYLALVAGDPGPNGVFRSELARRRRTNLVCSVKKGGKSAVTHFSRLAVADGCSFVAIRLETGRMHQIRAHFSEAGHPLLGDHRYAGPRFLADYPINRPMLHAAGLRLRHPVSGGMLRWWLAPPDDFTQVWIGLGGEADLLKIPPTVWTDYVDLPSN